MSSNAISAKQAILPPASIGTTLDGGLGYHDLFDRNAYTYVEVGPLSRANPGDTVTVYFRTRSALLPWQATIDVVAGDVGKEIVCRIPMVNVAFYLNRMPALYYRVTSADGGQRFSPRFDVLVSDYVPRSVYGLACAMRRRIEDAAVSECLADDTLILTVDGPLMALRPGDRLVLILRGGTVATSKVIPTTIGEGTDVDTRMSFPLPAGLIRENAGGTISYRAMKIRGSYIEVTPFVTLTIRPIRIRRIAEDTLRRFSRRTDQSPRPAPAQSPARTPNARHPARS